MATTVTLFADSPVIYSDNFEAKKDLVIYWGNVSVVTDKYRIFADYIIYHQKKSEIEAKGRVVMTSTNVSISGDNLVFNLKEQKGEMSDVMGMMEPSVKFRVDSLTQTDPVTQKFKKMKFTSCAQLVPRWEISCSKGKIKKNKYIEMKNAVLKVKKIPVFYFPYLRYPVKNSKVTGFLFPVIGSSENLGFMIKNGFFLNIRSNFDITFSFDYIQKVGLGLGTDIRYLFRKSRGEINLYGFKYRDSYRNDDTNRISGSSDLILKANHIQQIKFLNTKIKADINYQTNPEFQNIFDKNFGRFYMSRFSSNLYINSSISNLKLAVILSRNETFYLERQSSNVITKLPGVTLNLNQQKLWSIPGYFSLSAGYENIKRQGISYEEEIDYASGINSKRFSLIPSYTLNLFKLPWLSTTLNLRSKNSYYLKSRDLETKEIVNEPLHLNYNSLKLTFKGPLFYKIYSSHRSKIKHLIEPEINISYSTKISDDQRKRLIPIDIFDFPSYSSINFSLNSRILKKSRGSDKAAREVLTLTIGQKFYFDPFEANRFRSIEVDGENIYPEFSELNNSIRYRPSRLISFDLSVVYNHYLKIFQRVNLSISYSNPTRTVSGSLSYGKYINPYKTSSFFLNRETFRGDFKLNVPGFPVKLETSLDYDKTEKRFRYGSVILSYNYQCIKFNAEFKVYTTLDGKINPYYTFGVSLGNLGMIRDFFGGTK